MVNSTSMSSERAIPDLWEVFGSRGPGLGIRRNSWQKMQMQLSEEERAVTELFNDIHLHAGLPADTNNSPAKYKNSNQRNNRTEEYNERNAYGGQAKHNDWEHIEKHLSMKKTIRKKMMRDLQQAFIDGQDPGDMNQPSWEHNVQLDAHKAGVEPSLLDMLKDKTNEANNQSPKEQSASTKKPGFWKKLTMRKSSSSSKR